MTNHERFVQDYEPDDKTPATEVDWRNKPVNPDVTVGDILASTEKTVSLTAEGLLETLMPLIHPMHKNSAKKLTRELIGTIISDLRNIQQP
jgi:hypothetical protein